MIQVYGGSRSPHWLTPPGLVERLGPFDLDPCALSGQPWPTARRMIAPPEDGLAIPWQGRVWLNPPYGRVAGRWVDALARHGMGTALLYARTDAGWFHRLVWGRADALLFLRGRFHFHLPDGSRAAFNTGGPMALAAYGSGDARILGHCGIAGAFVTGWRRPEVQPDLFTRAGD